MDMLYRVVENEIVLSLSTNFDSFLRSIHFIFCNFYLKRNTDSKEYYVYLKLFQFTDHYYTILKEFLLRIFTLCLCCNLGGTFCYRKMILSV